MQLYWFKYVCSPGFHSCFGTEWYIFHHYVLLTTTTTTTTNRTIFYHQYQVNFDEETNTFVYHQSKIVVGEALKILGKLMRWKESCKMVSNWYHMLKYHANIVEALEKIAWSYNVTLTEDIEMEKEEEENDNAIMQIIKMKRKKTDNESRVGDIFICIGGTEQGSSK